MIRASAVVADAGDGTYRVTVMSPDAPRKAYRIKAATADDAAFEAIDKFVKEHEHDGSTSHRH